MPKNDPNVPQETRELEDRYQLQTYAKLPISVERGTGCSVYDEEGNEYLDLYGGHAVASTGHCHPRLVNAIQKQSEKLIFYSNATYNSVRAKAAQKLIEMAGEPYRQVFFANSGAEANENAIKLARALTGRTEIISTKNAFHGRTYGSLSSTGIDKYRNYLNTPVPDHRVLHYDEIVGMVSAHTAAVLVEPIQSMAGIVVIPPETLRNIAEACCWAGSLLIFDEIQTGVGRTGKFLYSDQVDVKPAITTLAKGLASGYPIGAVLVTEEIASQVKLGDLGSTFGGGPLSSAAMLETLEIIADEQLMENVTRTSRYLMERLAGLQCVAEIRGTGFLLGIRFKGKSAKDVQKALFTRKVLAGSSFDPEVLRLMPPLPLGKKDVDRFVEVLEGI
jgi:acetylornithine/succinyldiaminopimelate/putrescine aminotransferase